MCKLERKKGREKEGSNGKKEKKEGRREKEK